MENKGQNLYNFLKRSLGTSESVVPYWDLFLDFLEKQGALQKYLANYVAWVITNTVNFSLFNPAIAKYWITYAFAWNTSLEGPDYWCDLDREWRKHLDNLQKLQSAKKREHKRIAGQIEKLVQEQEILEQTKEKLETELDSFPGGLQDIA